MTTAAPTLRPFDLEAAKRGEPMATFQGTKATFVAFTPDVEMGLVVKVEGESRLWILDKDGTGGSLRRIVRPSIYMTPKMETAYVFVYRSAVWGNVYTVTVTKDTPAAATGTSDDELLYQTSFEYEVKRGTAQPARPPGPAPTWNPAG